MNLFNRNKANIESIIIPDFGWVKKVNEKNFQQWLNSDQTMALSINYFDESPDLPSIDIEVLRDFYRKQMNSISGGIVELIISKLIPYFAIKTIFKIPQEPNGMTYLASIVIPFKNCSYVIKIQAPEVGLTGMRDSTMVSKLLAQNVIQMGENGLEGWFRDPYNPQIKDGLLMNLSEEEKYDSDFPNHPLSKTREMMKEIESKIEFKKEIAKLRRF